MTDEELVSELRKLAWSFGTDAADRIEALVKERDILIDRHERNLIVGAETRARAERLEAAIDYILDGMGIDAPDYEIDPDDDFLDAANSDWVRDVLTRLAAALKGEDHE